MSFSYYDFIPSFRFSTEEEKKRMNNALAEKACSTIQRANV